ncbi:hypothetical protein CYY_000811 [Polysphondylium violaceum]|uniref:Lipase n=1 Tax=Polysphondylium violaceum TaxID=133409 RepID=A0A8J4VB55_9MYCE|nr:hypothetical protein CYY_000811 [Polysphondylium violaceum]
MNNIIKTILLIVVSIQLVNCLTVSQEASSSIEEIVASYGYPIEKHSVLTTDGYILTVHRIPFGKNGKTSNNKPILLQHGLCDSSFTWIFNLPGYGLGYILADQGYDVWMINFRGNAYSLGHTKFTDKDSAFWDFSFDQLGLYDTPNTIDYILRQTGATKCAIVGHSQGNQAAWISFLRVAGFSNKVSYVAALAPISTITNMRNDFFNVMAELHVDGALVGLGFQRFLPKPSTLRKEFILYCGLCKRCCATGIEMLVGPHNGPFNDTRNPVISGHEPAGTSLKNMQHFSQIKRNKKFQMFDYGKDNQKMYKQSSPPVYDLTKLPNNLNLAFFYGKEDVLSTTTDVQILINQLPKGVLKHSQLVDNYAHIDFVWSLDANTLIYSKIIEQLKVYH